MGRHFQAWAAFAAHCRREREVAVVAIQLKHQRKQLRRAQQHWAGRTASRVFCAWVAWTQRSLDEVRLCVQAVARHMHKHTHAQAHIHTRTRALLTCATRLLVDWGKQKEFRRAHEQRRRKMDALVHAAQVRWCWCVRRLAPALAATAAVHTQCYHHRIAVS